MNCFMFPGQPLSRSATLPVDDDFSAIAGMVRERARFDLESFSWLGEGSTDNVKLQLFGVAMSIYQARKMRRQGVTPDLVAEHSMGIYPALAACGCLPEAEVVELTCRVGSCLAQMGKSRRYALGCVIGLTLEPLLAVAENNGVHLANHNTSRHFLLAGTRPDMETAMAEALAQGAFSAKTFDCDAPLHTPLMAEAEEELRDIFADYHYAEPFCPLMDHLDQEYLTAADLADFMLRQLFQPVFWEKTYHALRASGVRTFFEVGVGDSLKKYNRWIESEHR
ncbi:ACP S-malonyltransferase [Geotalea uraniireducens]|uniref:[acyl-carrier-protein] S-malonyltransferase n=1 Tax=Geotalea uraniireducens (strain Rf4) TaxID=351605 RepID=A5G7J6_GEOUR|nr:acyltransferase domain-containing protein [Geotalea uraniireducens]ABQ27764.1 (acyl-carrier-protein) S-malonyltransferase-like protein [Geotalea uraniireducens Rf4]